jgi:hypothetical protein
MIEGRLREQTEVKTMEKRKVKALPGKFLALFDAATRAELRAVVVAEDADWWETVGAVMRLGLVAWKLRQAVRDAGMAEEVGDGS